MFNFDFLEKGLGVVSRPHFVYDFSRKMCPMLHTFNLPNFIIWMPLLLEILGSMCIVIVFLPDCDVINFEINFIFLIKPFFYMTKKSRQNLNILREKRAFFHHFERAFSWQKLSQTWECVFKAKQPFTVTLENTCFEIFANVMGESLW